MSSDEIREILMKRKLKVANNDDEVKECVLNKTAIDHAIECVQECKLSKRLVVIANHIRTHKNMKFSYELFRFNRTIMTKEVRESKSVSYVI